MTPAFGRCAWQTGYGLPWTERCQSPADADLVPDLCQDHQDTLTGPDQT